MANRAGKILSVRLTRKRRRRGSRSQLPVIRKPLVAKNVSTAIVPRVVSPIAGSLRPVSAKEWETTTATAASRRRTSKLFGRETAGSTAADTKRHLRRQDVQISPGIGEGGEL